jgi:6-phosphofructokinase 1
MRIGILTGGSDASGLNACIKAVVYHLVGQGHIVLGIRRGWAGLLWCQPEQSQSILDWTVSLDHKSVRTIDRTGGTILHTSHVIPSNIPSADVPKFLKHQISGKGPYDFTAHVLHVIEKLNIDALIAIGGDMTLTYALRLHNEGIPIVAIPKTIYNDVIGTDYCIGFASAITRSITFIQNMRTNAGSHEHIGIIELFGQRSGKPNIMAAYLAGVDRTIIPEVPFDIEKLANLLMTDKRSNPSRYAMMTISEGAHMIQRDHSTDCLEPSAGSSVGIEIGRVTKELLKKLTGQGIIYQRLGYLMCSGDPVSLDLMVAINFAVMTADLIMGGSYGRMVVLQDGKYTHVPLEVIAEGFKQVDVDELYDTEQYRARIRRVEGNPMFLK